MKRPPEYPEWQASKPPAVGKWLAAGALFALLLGGCAALLRNPSNGGTGVILIAMLAGLIITGLCWLWRLVYHRASLHHAANWHHQTEQERSLWWEQHQSLLALQTVILTGPAGSDASDWIRVLNREQKPPAEHLEVKGRGLRTSLTFTFEPGDREQQLARSLVLLWKKNGSKFTAHFARCFWLGSNAAWRAFSAQMSVTFPGIVLPFSPERWRGEETLSLMAASLQVDSSKCFLVAGCVSSPAYAGASPSTGEAAVLWVSGAEGHVVMPRGEVFDASSSESLSDVCTRALQQAKTEKVPDACILFSHPSLAQLDGNGWNTTQYVQDSYWGKLGEIEPLVVISLAAILAQHQNKPCCWIASDPQYTLALGVIKPYGKG